MFLDFAEMRLKQRKTLRMEDWRGNVDSFIAFNENPVLQGAGRVNRDEMTKVAHQRYGEFDVKRRRDEALRADLEEMDELKRVEQ